MVYKTTFKPLKRYKFLYFEGYQWHFSDNDMTSTTNAKELFTDQTPDVGKMVSEIPKEEFSMSNPKKKWNNMPNELEYLAHNPPKPTHYANGIDTFQRMEANCTKEECLAFAKGNIDKYNWREKGQDLEDFNKIISYAQWAIKLLTK